MLGVITIDIALLSMAMGQGHVKQQASLSLMKQSLGNAEQQGDALQKLMSTADVKAIQQAAEPHLGQSIDIKI